MGESCRARRDAVWARRAHVSPRCARCDADPKNINYLPYFQESPRLEFTIELIVASTGKLDSLSGTVVTRVSLCAPRNVLNETEAFFITLIYGL